MAKSRHHFGNARVIGASVGGYVHGTGGTRLWWKKYDAAAAYFSQHGNLDGFPDSQWIAQVRTQRANGWLLDDQLHFLNKINFDFSKQKARPKSRTPSRADQAIALKQRFEIEGRDGLSDEERTLLRAELQYFSTQYSLGPLSETKAALMGVSDPDTYRALMRALG